jgi:subtilisin family serine protease
MAVPVVPAGMEWRMRRIATAGILAIATVFAALTPARGQVCTFACTSVPPPGSSPAITPLGWYAGGALFAAAAAPIIGTIVLGREMTPEEVYRSTLISFLGPVGWWLGNEWFPDKVAGRNPLTKNPPSRGARPGQGRNINIPPPSEIRLVPDEVLLQVAPGVSQRALERIANQLQIAPQETHSFTLTGRTLQRWRITGNLSVASTLRAALGYPGIAAAQPNYLYELQQSAAAAATDTSTAQYVVSKLRLTEAHRISSGDDVLVAVIDSKIDSSHADLAGVIVDEYDVIGTPGPAHSHGTAMAGAIAAHSKLIGVAPKVKLLAVRAFSGGSDSAQATTFNIMKGLDWAAAKNARIVNMSFAGPADSMMRDMLGKANARGIVLVAAVGNAGPSSPPLFPAANAHVIGITATDAEDRLLPQANRGTQVAVAAPGVEILAAAPEGGYQVTSGTSVAAAHASGVAALLLARDARLTPAQVRNAMIRSAHPVAGSRRDYGAGVIDALAAVNSLPR